MPWQTFGRYKKRHQARASSGIGVGYAVTRLLPFFTCHMSANTVDLNNFVSDLLLKLRELFL